MNKFYVADNQPADADTQVEIISNGQQGDAKVTLYKALDADSSVDPDNANWVYYLQTNGDPVLITSDDNTDAVEVLGLPLEEVKAAIVEKLAEGESGEYPLEYLD